MISKENSKEIGEQPVPVPLRLLRILHVVIRDWTRACCFRSPRLTARTISRPSFVYWTTSRTFRIGNNVELGSQVSIPWFVSRDRGKPWRTLLTVELRILWEMKWAPAAVVRVAFLPPVRRFPSGDPTLWFSQSVQIKVETVSHIRQRALRSTSLEVPAIERAFKQTAYKCVK